MHETTAEFSLPKQSTYNETSHEYLLKVLRSRFQRKIYSDSLGSKTTGWNAQVKKSDIKFSVGMETWRPGNYLFCSFLVAHNSYKQRYTTHYKYTTNTNPRHPACPPPEPYLSVQEGKGFVDVLDLVDAHLAVVGFAEFLAGDDLEQLEQHLPVGQVGEQVHHLEPRLWEGG